MGRVRVTEKPGEWPYVLVNDCKNPSYFAYEQVADDGSKRFIRVLRGGPVEKSPARPPLNLNLTALRKCKIAQFLKTVLKEPLKFGKYMSSEWVIALIKYLDLFDEDRLHATSGFVANWLKDKAFRKLIEEIEKNCGCVGAKDSEEGTPTESSSSSSSEMEASEYEKLNV